MVPTKDQTPHVPITTRETLDDVERCRALGAWTGLEDNIWLGRERTELAIPAREQPAAV